MYALAASAAGVGLLSLAQPVEAKIIYTPADEHVCATYLAVKQAAAGNGIADYVSVDGVRWASALKKGKRIGADGRFYSYGFIGSLVNGSLLRPGPWYDAGNRYLGLKFQIHGQTHYAWARLRIKVTVGYPTGSIVGTLTGYAYETIPNKPIIAGKITGPDVITLEPGSLGWLALGK
jgi:hypothetical protein